MHHHWARQHHWAVEQPNDISRGLPRNGGPTAAKGDSGPGETLIAECQRVLFKGSPLDSQLDFFQLDLAIDRHDSQSPNIALELISSGNIKWGKPAGVFAGILKRLEVGVPFL